MEYFNRNDEGYRKALKRNAIIRYLIKIELLSINESTIGEITKDLTLDVQGQININYKQLTRRSCSLTVANVEGKYIPSPKNPFWYQRKFKLWIGIMDDKHDIYWWSQGVYYTQSATGNQHTISIEGIDKGGALDGTLRTNLAEVQYIVEAGNTVSNIIRDTLALNMGAGTQLDNSVAYGGASQPIDPVQPLIDLRYNDQKIKADISLDTNNYLGTLITNIADSYGADVFYDRDGRMRFTSLADIFFVDGYKYIAHSWDFINLTSGFANPNYQYDFSGCNAVTVYTNLSVETQALIRAQEEKKESEEPDDEEENSSQTTTAAGSISQEEETNPTNISYTAYNVNPMSPLRVGAVGLRQMESVEIDYIDTTNSDMKARCQQYAVMLLHKQSMIGMTLSFDCPIIPHLDVNNTIGVTDEYQDIEAETFVIQSITIPLGAGSMNVSATNINWLPSNTNMEGMGVG